MPKVILVILATCLAANVRAAPAETSGPAPGETPVSGIGFPVTTRHEGVFNGRAVRYTATLDAYDVVDADGEPGARVVATSYVAETAPDAPPRPVVFIWNGGPISPSVYLHMGAFGPKRVAFPDDLKADPSTAPLEDNPYSILDAADLVYFDPAGTGFSRPLPGKALDEYFSVQADAQQTAAFIAEWLHRHQRRDSPAYIFGESYGTNRAVEVASQLAQLDEPVLLDGVALFGQAVNIIEYAQRPMNVTSYVVSLPTLAAIGWHHGKVATDGTDFESFVESAWEYARTDYLQALFQGNALPQDRLREVAERLAGFSGLDAGVFVDQRLRVSKEDFRRELFRDEGLIIGYSDGRYTAPLEPEGDEPDARPQDPAMGLPQRLVEAHRQYLVDDLGVESADQYVTESPVQGLGEWGWSGQSPFSRFAYGEAMAALFEKNPGARVLVMAGYHDTMTTVGASKLLAAQEAWPRDRVTLAFYRGGHMAYSVGDSVRRMAADLRRLVTPE